MTNSKETIEAICALEGKLSASEVGRQFGMSKNAVCGVWHRNRRLCVGYEPPAPHIVPPTPSAQRKPSESRPKLPPPPAEPVVVPPPPGHGAVRSVAMIRNGRCRFPIGDPIEPDFRFCFEATDPGRPYCAVHAAACFDGRVRRLVPVNHVRAA